MSRHVPPCPTVSRLVPRGKPRETGETGETGGTGETGETGVTGETGEPTSPVLLFFYQLLDSFKSDWSRILNHDMR